MAVRVSEAHVELLVGLQVAAEHVGDDEGVVVFAVEEVGEEDVFVAVDVVAAVGAGPGGDGLVGAEHEVRVGGGVDGGCAAAVGAAG